MEKLTKKQKAFLDGYIKTGNATKSALEVYDTDNYHTAGVIAHENLKKPKIINALQEALPDELLAKVHREGLFATKEIWREIDKESVHVADEADFAVRAKYLDMAYKVKGNYAPTKQFNLNIEVKEPSAKVKDLAKRLNYGV